ncbi:MAG: hypothetical protein ACP5R2_04315, partial [Anaerolineae bacterium]
MFLRQRWIGWGLVLFILWGSGIVMAACSSSSWQELSAKVATFTPTPALKLSPTLIVLATEVTASDEVMTSPIAEVTKPSNLPAGPGTPVVVTYRTAEPTRTPTRTPTAAGPTPTATVVIPERPEGENPLTGLIVSDPSVLRRRPIALRVGNDPAAR